MGEQKEGHTDPPKKKTEGKDRSLAWTLRPPDGRRNFLTSHKDQIPEKTKMRGIEYNLRIREAHNYC